MKFGKLRTLRGQITVAGGAGKKALITADGLINYGLKIESFRIWPSVNNATTSKWFGILSLNTIIAASEMNAGDNRQIGWNYIDHGYGAERTILDPDHVVNRDLALNITGTNATYNYLIEARVVELTDDEAIVTIIKETSQS